MDAFANFAYSLVAVPPDPPESGDTLIVTAGTGGRYPEAPFNLVVCAAGVMPTPETAEIVRVTDRVNDTLYLLRQQEQTTARTIVAGDQAYAAITKKTLDDILFLTRNVWRYRARASGAVGNGDVAWTPSQPTATTLTVSHVTSDGLNIARFLIRVRPTDQLIIQEADADDHWQMVGLTGPGVDMGTAYAFPVEVLDAAGRGTTGFANNKQLLIARSS